MSDPKRPEDQHDASDTIEGADIDSPQIEDAELVETPNKPPEEDELIALPDDATDDIPAEDEVNPKEPHVAPPVTPWGGAPADVSARSTSDPSSPAYVAPVNPEQTPDPAPVVEEEYHEDTGSVAGRVLFWLFLLVAGGVLILWAGPKIAPSLPSGLAPVAEWLTPGQRAAQLQVDEMEQRLNARIDTLDTGITPQGVTQQIDTAIAESESLTAENITALSAQINDLSDQVAASDSTPIEERLAQAETRLEGLAAEMSALRNDLTGLAAGEGGITGQNAAQIDAFTAALNGVQAELDSISARNGAQDQRIDEVAATAERQLRTAREEVAAVQAQAEAQVAVASEQAAMVELANALDTGEAFEAPLATLADQAEIPAALTDVATDGVPTQMQLETTFPETARLAIRADIAPGEGDGILSSATSFLRARVAGRSLVERDGDDADAVLSRVEARLRRGDLEAALTEAEQLSGPASDTLSDWTADLRARHDALSAYRTLAERLDAGN